MALSTEPRRNKYQFGVIPCLMVLTVAGISSTLLGQSYVIGTFTSGYPSGFAFPTGYTRTYITDLTLDSSGNLYYAVNDSVFVRSRSGQMKQLAGEGTVFWPHYESGLGVGAGGAVYVSSSDEGCDVVKIVDGIATVFAGTEKSGYNGDNIPAASATGNYPKGVVEDSLGRVYIADGDNQRVRMVSKGIITTLIGGLDQPSGLALDAAGNLYIADDLANVVYKFSNGNLTVVAGIGGPGGFGGDGGPATLASLNYPRSVAVDVAGNLYIADVKNNRVRKVTAGVITTIAGDGTSGFGGDGGSAISAQLSRPWSVAVDAAGNVYVSDLDNARIRLLTPTLRSRNSASYTTATAPDMIALAEAIGLTSDLIVAPPGSWPASLAGVSATITDSRHQTLQAPIYFVGPGQLGYLVPDSTALGPATLEVATAPALKVSTPIFVERVAPGLYSANSSGEGVAAALWIRIAPDGTQTWGFLFDPAMPVGSRVAVPVELRATGDALYLSLFGTGFRGASSVSARVGGMFVPVYGFGPVSQYQGEDVVNIGPLPSSLAGQGEVDVTLTFDGKAANTVTVSLR